MNVQLFNAQYFLFLFLSVGFTVGLYFILKNKSKKTQKIVLFLLLVFSLALHFTKFLYPPYSTDRQVWLRNSWFINISGANIAVFPFIFCSKSNKWKDYMFYIGLISGVISVIYPVEPIEKVNQAGEWIDIIRFYTQHTIIYCVPLLMVLFNIHTLNYKRILLVPISFLEICGFIVLNQWLQSELGFVSLF